MALVGHSAGGHLVAVAGTDPALLARAGADPEAVGCVVALDSAATVLDAGNPLHAAAFGTDPAVLAGASPLVLVERNGAPPAEFLVVARGRPARVAAQRSFADAITAAGGTATFVDANPLDHAGVASALGRDGDGVVTPAVRDVLDRCLAP
jgi:acetyl esterase/lipase